MNNKKVLNPTTINTVIDNVINENLEYCYSSDTCDRLNIIDNYLSNYSELMNTIIHEFIRYENINRDQFKKITTKDFFVPFESLMYYGRYKYEFQLQKSLDKYLELLLNFPSHYEIISLFATLHRNVLNHKVLVEACSDESIVKNISSDLTEVLVSPETYTSLIDIKVYFSRHDESSKIINELLHEFEYFCDIIQYSKIIPEIQPSNICLTLRKEEPPILLDLSEIQDKDLYFKLLDTFPNHDSLIMTLLTFKKLNMNLIIKSNKTI